MGTQSFQKTYKSLNPAQRKAVDTIEGPVMVVAGPGTGKTHVLAARIANILKKTDTPPYAILALTFTESAAANMRDRVVEMIGHDGYYVRIMTFHSFCTDVIRTHPEYFPIDRGSEPLSDLEKYDIFQEIIKKTKLDILKPINAPNFYLREVVFAISNLKREGVTPDDFQKTVKAEFTKALKQPDLKKWELARLKKQADKNKELARLYKAYQHEIRKRQRYDFDDMIALVVEAFSDHKMLLREYQEQLLYFLIDEYQDTNTAQNMVVEKLASYWGEKANLFVVGDPNQSIYRFQGASIENTLNFSKLYPKADIITLDKGYRCSQNLYDAAHDVIVNNKLTQEDSLRDLHEAVTKKIGVASSSAGTDTKITVAKLPSQILELIYVAEKIKKLLKKGVVPEDIAILYRQNADSIQIQQILEKWGIPYEIEGGENILESEYVRQLLQYMKVVTDVRTGNEDEKLFEIMSYEWTNIDPVLAMKIGRAAGKAKVSIADLIHKGRPGFQEHHIGDEVTEKAFSEAVDFLKELEIWNIKDGQLVFTELFEKIVGESGYLDYILSKENRIELLINLNSLFREVKALVADRKNMKLVDFLKAVDLMREHKINIFAEDLNVQKGFVRLSTVHKAKGHEWKYVFMIHCTDKKWGNVRKRELIPLPHGLLKNTDLDKKELNEDERRIFYVALTRAESKSYITYSRTIISDHRSRDVIGCMFIEEISPELVKKTEPQDISEKSIEHVKKLLQPKQSPFTKITDTDYLHEIIKDFKMSVTALNTYLRDKDEFLQNVLLRVPRAKPPVMAFGSAVHYALELMYGAKLTGAKYTKSQLLDDFEEFLSKEVLTIGEFKRRLSHGRKILAQYYDEYKEEEVDILSVERFFGYGARKAVLDDIYLVGRVDRIDWVDRSSKTVRVVDYKTGKSKTMGEIEGKTVSAHLSEDEHALPESIRGPYKRQLLFYALLAELDRTFPYSVKEGVFDFVEPNKQSGKLMRRSLVIERSDLQDMKALIRRVMKDMRNLSFIQQNP